MPLVTITVGRHTAEVQSPYDPARIDIIKTVPGRSWNKDRKTWSIPANWVAHLKAALEDHGDKVTVIGQPDPGPAADANPRGAHAATIARLEREKQRLQQEIIRLKNAQATASQNWAEVLLSKLTPEQADKAHKALTRVLHPDVGGNTELMQQLNVARDLTGRYR